MTAPVHVALPLPALAVLTGGTPAAGYCPACLDTWFGYGKHEPEAARTTRMHQHCRALLEELHAAAPTAVHPGSAAGPLTHTYEPASAPEVTP